MRKLFKINKKKKEVTLIYYILTKYTHSHTHTRTYIVVYIKIIYALNFYITEYFLCIYLITYTLRVLKHCAYSTL